MLVKTGRAGRSLLPPRQRRGPSLSHGGRDAGAPAGSRSGLVQRRAGVPSVRPLQSGSKQEEAERAPPPTAAAFSQLPPLLSEH